MSSLRASGRSAMLVRLLRGSLAARTSDEFVGPLDDCLDAIKEVLLWLEIGLNSLRTFSFPEYIS